MAYTFTYTHSVKANWVIHSETLSANDETTASNAPVSFFLTFHGELLRIFDTIVVS